MRFLGATVELCSSRLLLSPLPSNAHTTSKVITLGWGKEKKKEKKVIITAFIECLPCVRLFGTLSYILAYLIYQNTYEGTILILR